MALVLGVNCGFVPVAPVIDPAGAPEWFDSKGCAFKDTTPAGAVKITEIGWWCDNATEAADFEVGIYDHNAGDNNPENLIGKSAATPKGTGSGWMTVKNLNIPVSPETIYWIAVQLDDVATPTWHNYFTDAGYKWDAKLLQTELEDPWGVSAATQGRLVAYYAVWEYGASSIRARQGAISKKPLSADVVPGLY